MDDQTMNGAPAVVWADPIIRPLRRGTAPAYGRSASGFGSKIPTGYTVRLCGRWRRVYVMQYGNAGSAYVVYQGVRCYLQTIFQGDTTAAIRSWSSWSPERGRAAR